MVKTFLPKTRFGCATRPLPRSRDHIRRTIGEFNFAGQYQQSLAPLGGGMVKGEWFKRLAPRTSQSALSGSCKAEIPKNKATEPSDYSVCTTWGVNGKNLHLLGLLRPWLEYPALKRTGRDQQSLYNANVVLIEDKASGPQLIQELIAEGCHTFTRYQPDGDKSMRMHTQTAMIENGFVHLPETAPRPGEYRTRSPPSPRANTTTRSNRPPVPRLVQNAFSGPGDLRLYRRQAEEAERRRRSPVQTEWAKGSNGMARRAEQIEATAKRQDQTRPCIAGNGLLPRRQQLDEDRSAFRTGPVLCPRLGSTSGVMSLCGMARPLQTGPTGCEQCAPDPMAASSGRRL